MVPTLTAANLTRSTDVAVRDATGAENPELATAKAYLQEAQDEQASTLVDVLEHFAKLLPADVNRNDWETWWLEGWVRELCRTVSRSALSLARGLARIKLTRRISRAGLRPQVDRLARRQRTHRQARPREQFAQRGQHRRGRESVARVRLRLHLAGIFP